MGVHLVTFGYDHGEPPSADRVYDVRGEKYQPKEWARKAQEIADDAEDGEIIAIGCKHGDTRSVQIAEDTKKRLGRGTTLTHLDKDKKDALMPLMEGDDQKIVNENIREMRRSGYPEDQAVAAAYRKAGKAKKPKKMKKGKKHMVKKG